METRRQFVKWYFVVHIILHEFSTPNLTDKFIATKSYWKGSQNMKIHKRTKSYWKGWQNMKIHKRTKSYWKGWQNMKIHKRTKNKEICIVP